MQLCTEQHLISQLSVTVPSVGSPAAPARCCGKGRQKPGRGGSANNNKRNCERERRRREVKTLIWMCLVTDAQLFKACLIRKWRRTSGIWWVWHGGLKTNGSATVQMMWYSQHVLISPPRVFVISHLFTVNGICELLRCVAVQWCGGMMGPFLHHCWDWESLGAVDKHESDSAGHENRLQYLAQHTLGFILGGIQLREVRVMDTFCKHLCPSKAWVKFAVASNDCWFTGVWIWPTSASLACSPLLSPHSCHEWYSHVMKTYV